MFKKSSGKYLTQIGLMHGLSRRGWWVLKEPDFMFRPRLLSQIRIVPCAGGYVGAAKNHLGARLRRWLRKWRTLDFFGAHFGVALGLFAMLYLAVG